MIKLFKAFQAPQSYVFVDPDTKHKYHATSESQIIADIIHYREQNQLPPIEHLNTVLHNYWCSLPENAGKCEPSNKLDRDFYAYIKGGVALVAAYLYKTFTTQEEAERRASICASCPANQFPDKTGFIEFSDNLAARMTGNKRTKLHAQLGNCGCCTCLLKSKVFYGGKIELDKDQLVCIKTINPNCWQVEGK